MKPIKKKSEVRIEMEKEIRKFLSKGGEVKIIPTGVSGNETNNSYFRHPNIFEPRKERTPLHEIVKQLEARKSSKNATTSVKKSKPKKRLITDDFGEPVRWVWENDNE